MGRRVFGQAGVSAAGQVVRQNVHQNLLRITNIMFMISIIVCGTSWYLYRNRKGVPLFLKHGLYVVVGRVPCTGAYIAFV